MYQENELVTYNDVVTKHAPLVKRIAHHLMGRLPANIQVDDLIQAGMIGLLEAAKNYSTEKGASFETYAGIRIRGSMLDEIRKCDWAPRSVHRNSRRIAEAIRKIEHETGRDAKDSEVAKELDVTIEQYHAMLQDSLSVRIFGFDDLTDGDASIFSGVAIRSSEPLERIQSIAFKETLTKEIALLPERERLVLALYYNEELNLKEVGEVLGVSESRISQLHSQAMLRLQSRIKVWHD
jgi:RNA polymerase sigma factor FliA